MFDTTLRDQQLHKFYSGSNHEETRLFSSVAINMPLSKIIKASSEIYEAIKSAEEDNLGHVNRETRKQYILVQRSREDWAMRPCFKRKYMMMKLGIKKNLLYGLLKNH